jgi:hypothetical protein
MPSVEGAVEGVGFEPLGVDMRFPYPLAQKQEETRSRRDAEDEENGQNAFFDTTESQCLAKGCIASFHFHLCLPAKARRRRTPSACPPKPGGGGRPLREKKPSKKQKNMRFHTSRRSHLAGQIFGRGERLRDPDFDWPCHGLAGARPSRMQLKVGEEFCPASAFKLVE